MGIPAGLDGKSFNGGNSPALKIKTV